MVSKSFRIVFAGTPNFAVPSFTSLFADERFDVVAVFTQPDRASGRGQKLTASPVKIFARENNLPVYQPEKIGMTEIELLQKLAPDFIVTAAYGILLPEKFLAIPKFGCVNVHASLLPRWRGASPITAAILAGDAETGISFMQTISKLDAGPVFSRTIWKLNNTETTGELTESLARLGGAELPDALARITAGEIHADPQNEALTTYAKKIKKTDGQIAWRFDTPEMLARKIRAFSPWPGIFTHHAGKLLKILALEPRVGKPPEILAGTIFREGEEIRVACFTDSVALKQVQLEGRKALSIDEFMRGEKNFVGARLW